MSGTSGNSSDAIWILRQNSTQQRPEDNCGLSSNDELKQ